MLSSLSFDSVFVAIYLVIAVIVGKKKQISIIKQIISFIFFAYFLVVINITFFPIPIDPNVINISRLAEDTIHQNWIPFSTIYFMLKYSLNNINSLLNIVGNVLLFAPFGFLLPMISRKLSTKVIPLGIFVILIIEVSQLVSSNLYGFTYRIFDVDDVILNTIGLLIGVILYRVLIRVFRKTGLEIPL